MMLAEELSKYPDLYFDGGTYVDWLKSFTMDESIETERRPSYDRLLKKLWDIPYRPSVGNDHSRAVDGKSLRNDYRQFVGIEFGLHDTRRIRGSDDIYGPCRVLEMLIALSMRMYDMMQDMGYFNSVARWFWEIIENVGLDECTDLYFSNHPECGEIIDELVNDILDSEDHGWEPGGWFYLSGWWRTELWYQMNAYLNEYFR